MFRAAGQTRPIAIGAVIVLALNATVSTTLVILGNKGIVSFIGPAIGTSVAEWCCWAYLLWQITWVTGVPFSRIMRWKELSRILLVSVVCGAIVFVVPLSALPLMLKLAVQAAIYLVIFLTIVLMTRLLNEDENKILFCPWNFLKKKVFSTVP